MTSRAPIIGVKIISMHARKGIQLVENACSYVESLEAVDIDGGNRAKIISRPARDINLRRWLRYTRARAHVRDICIRARTRSRTVAHTRARYTRREAYTRATALRALQIAQRLTDCTIYGSSRTPRDCARQRGRKKSDLDAARNSRVALASP